MTSAKKGAERRKWQRLPLAIPVFVRGIEPSGRKFIEFATALDISVGGALLSIQRHLPEGSKIMLEIPSNPIPRKGDQGKAKQSLSAKLVRVTHGEQGQLLGLKFRRPMLSESLPSPAPKPKAKRKSSSSL